MMSVIGIALATAALVIVLSVFNGFGSLISRLYNSFQPALLVESVQAKSFLLANIAVDKLQQIEGVSYVQPVIEQSALLRYEKRQTIVKLKAVRPYYMQQSGLDTLIVQGVSLLQKGTTPLAVLGYGIAYNMQVQLRTAEQLQLFVPKKGVKGGVQLQNAFRRVPILPAGFFSVRQDFDEQYVFVPQSLLQAKDTKDYYATSLEIGLLPNADESKIQAQVQTIVGDIFSVKNRMQQQAVMQRVMQSEKLMIYFVLGFILLLAVFNIVGSISMLIVDKQVDMVTLKAMGAHKPLILSVFAWEGILISLAGAGIGMLLGAAVAYGQKRFGWISLGEGNFIVNAYPVRLIWTDFVWVGVMVLLMSSISVIYPLNQLAKKL